VKLLEETLQELQGQPSGTFEVRIDLGSAQLSRRWMGCHHSNSQRQAARQACRNRVPCR